MPKRKEGLYKSISEDFHFYVFKASDNSYRRLSVIIDTETQGRPNSASAPISNKCWKSMKLINPDFILSS